MTSQAQAGASNSSSIPHRRFGCKMGSFLVGPKRFLFLRVGLPNWVRLVIPPPAPPSLPQSAPPPWKLNYILWPQKLASFRQMPFAGQSPQERDETHEAPSKTESGLLAAPAGQPNLMTAAQITVNESIGHYSKPPPGFI
jgi:hypothetical protein